MHVVIGIIMLLAGVAFWIYRIQAAKQAGDDLLEGANDIRLTVRRLMYKRTHDVHPTDSVDDARLAAAGITVAVATMDNPISQTEIVALSKSAQEIFDVTEREALDIVSFGRWIAGECNTNQEAVRRLSKVLAKLAGPEAADDMQRLIRDVATADGHVLGEEEQDAIDTVRKALGVS